MNLLIRQSASMTAPEMSRHHKRPKKEIIAVLAKVNPRPLIERRYKMRGVMVIVYQAGFGFGELPYDNVNKV